MKALCPHCRDNAPCGKCQDGYIEVGFATGNIYTPKEPEWTPGEFEAHKAVEEFYGEDD